MDIDLPEAREGRIHTSLKESEAIRKKWQAMKIRYNEEKACELRNNSSKSHSSE